MNNNVRKITEGAMMTALVGVMLLIDRQFIGVAEMFVWALPLPMVFFTAKYGWKDALLPLGAMIVLTLILGSTQSIYYFTVTSAAGLIYGEGVKQKWSVRKLMIISMIILTMSHLVTTVFFAAFFGYDINREIQTMQQVFDQTIGTNLMPIAIDSSQMVRMAFMFSILLVGVLEGLLLHLVARILLSRFGFDIPKSKPLSQIIAPKWSGYVAIICWAFAEYMLRIPHDPKIQEAMMLVDIVANIYLIYYGYLGATVLGALKFRRNITFYLILFTVFFMAIAIPALSLFGFLYITTNWRENMLRRISNGQDK